MAVLWYIFYKGKRFARCAFDNSNVRNSLSLTKLLNDRSYLGMTENAQKLYNKHFLCENDSKLSRYHSSSIPFVYYYEIQSSNFAYKFPYVSGTIMKKICSSPLLKQGVGKYFDLIARPTKELIIRSPNTCNIIEENYAYKLNSRGNHIKHLHSMSFLGPFYMNGVKFKKNMKIPHEECLNTIIQLRKKSNSNKKPEKSQTSLEKKKKLLKDQEEIKNEHKKSKDFKPEQKLPVRIKSWNTQVIDERQPKIILPPDEQDILLTQLLNKNSLMDLHFDPNSLENKKSLKKPNLFPKRCITGKFPKRSITGKFPKEQGVDQAQLLLNNKSLNDLDFDKNSQPSKVKSTLKETTLDAKTGNTGKSPKDQGVDQAQLLPNNKSLNDLDLDKNSQPSKVNNPLKKMDFDAKPGNTGKIPEHQGVDQAQHSLTKSLNEVDFNKNSQTANETDVDEKPGNTGKFPEDQGVDQAQLLSCKSFNELECEKSLKVTNLDGKPGNTGELNEEQCVDQAQLSLNKSLNDLEFDKNSQPPKIKRLLQETDLDAKSSNTGKFPKDQAQLLQGKSLNDLEFDKNSQPHKMKRSLEVKNLGQIAGTIGKFLKDQGVDKELDLDETLKLKKSKTSKDQSILEKSDESSLSLDELDMLLKSYSKGKTSQNPYFLRKRGIMSCKNLSVKCKNKSQIPSNYENLMGNVNQAVLENLNKLPLPDNRVQATYVWVVENGLAVKDRILHEPPQCVEDLPQWSGCNLHKENPTSEEFEFSLIPKQYYNNPFKPNNGNVLVLCDTYNCNDKPLSFNKRAACCNTINKVEKLDPWFGFSQEYVILNRIGQPIGNKTDAINLARELAEAHSSACLFAGIEFNGINLERESGKCEYQIGPGRGLDAPDDLWISRYILKRIAEKMGLRVSFNSKHMSKGVLHTRVTFSTGDMRGEYGMMAIKKAIFNLLKYHAKDSRIYDHKQNKFVFAVGASNASIRIPLKVVRNGSGYVEDSRPSASSDPYDIVQTMLTTSLQEYLKISKNEGNDCENTKNSEISPLKSEILPTLE